MDLQNLSYALVQVAHNFGAASVFGASVFALWPMRQGRPERRRLMWVIFVAWAAQMLSGIGFGVTSYRYYGQLPDIHGPAIVALGIKVIAAMAGFGLAGLYLARAAFWNDVRAAGAFRLIAFLSIIALSAAAFLRWYS